ncbi:peptide ligase PGM1-related protein [Kitasatospora sp. NBC_01250]|uniref:preATP grasp domain-containing protein n=1 Tax=unclassified Kitasatospora TaxID=2633591 RepID=UPI002E0FFF37|nr:MULTISPECIES: hypothetical protein [unclassified Kitasatospora]WSJ70272.1 peptide ligase PGM1-related protein [Kitasatospora sp. NBC_01302]
MSRTILANINSDTMADHPGAAYLRAMAVVSPRTLWEARPGDCVVLLAPCGQRFREYVAGITGVPTGQVEIVEPQEITSAHALDVAEQRGAVPGIVARGELDCFALDRRVLDFVRRHGLRLHPYAEPPADEVLATVRLLNTKSGFRAAAQRLGLPLAAGGHAATRAELLDRAGAFLAGQDAVIIKPDRSSTGFGNVVVRAEPRASLAERLLAAVAEQGECGWVYEEFLPLTASPSAELIAEEAGVRDYYSCDQRTVNNAWTGMVTPAREDAAYQELHKAATVFADWLHGQGYRGVFDVDGGVYDGGSDGVTTQGVVLTESNVRVTGGTYLEKLARLLRPGEAPVHWRADGRRVPDSRLDFPTAVRRLESEGLHGSSTAVRAVLSTDTHHLDGKWRYLVVGENAEVVAEAERTVELALEL